MKAIAVTAAGLALFLAMPGAAEASHRRGHTMAGWCRADAAQMMGVSRRAVVLENRVLRTEGSALGLTPEFTILDREDAGDLLGTCRVEACVKIAEPRQIAPPYIKITPQLTYSSMSRQLTSSSTKSTTTAPSAMFARPSSSPSRTQVKNVATIKSPMARS